MRLDSRLPIRQIWSLDHALAVARVSTATLREERGKMAVCLLFLSGMRADALASIPRSCVDVARRAVYQLPEQGVRTKNRKAAITYLLEIPELLAVVSHWETILHAARIPPHALWYSNLTRDGMELIPTLSAFEGRSQVIGDDIRLICQRAEVPYLSPHKVRHGHTVYGYKRIQNMAQLKALSQNIMHASVVTTDSIYGKLVDDDVRQIIANL